MILSCILNVLLFFLLPLNSAPTQSHTQIRFIQLERWKYHFFPPHLKYGCASEESVIWQAKNVVIITSNSLVYGMRGFNITSAAYYVVCCPMVVFHIALAVQKTCVGSSSCFLRIKDFYFQSIYVMILSSEILQRGTQRKAEGDWRNR